MKRALTGPTRHGWVRHFIDDFETNAEVQYRIHMAFTYIWLVNMVIAVSVFLAFKGFWNRASVLYLVLVSLYANFATDYGAVSAAEAAQIPRGEHVEGTVALGSAAPVPVEGDVTVTPTDP